MLRLAPGAGAATQPWSVPNARACRLALRIIYGADPSAASMQAV